MSSKPPVDAVIGGQWGDETKGAFIDRMAGDYDIVLRPAGGKNAGHTVIVEGTTYKLRQTPSGIIRGKTSVLGSDMCVDPLALVEEIQTLRGLGVDTSKLVISDRASLLFPWHKTEDELRENALGNEKIGTTRYGIGPCYGDDCYRTGLRMYHLQRPREKFLEAVQRKMSEAISRLKSLDPSFSELPFSWEGLDEARDMLAPLVRDLPEFLEERRRRGESVLIEGAQGFMLDLRHGTYPHVTSSHPGIAGCLLGSGIPPQSLRKIIGVIKGYTTRVGGGPFPTQMDPETDDLTRQLGGEYGTGTNRPRQCGWLDLVQLRYALAENGVTELAVGKIDFLHRLPHLFVCWSYRRGEETLTYFPADTDGVTGVLTEIPKWDEPITGIKQREDLPRHCQDYLAMIEEGLGVPIRYISTGSERSDYIVC